MSLAKPASAERLSGGRVRSSAAVAPAKRAASKAKAMITAFLLRDEGLRSLWGVGSMGSFYTRERRFHASTRGASGALSRPRHLRAQSARGGALLECAPW